MRTSPHLFPKRILLAVSGMSPQIVTETLYSLAVKHTDPFIPTEIHLITTIAGAKEAKLQLLHPKTGKFQKLCSDYHLPKIDFLEENIHIIEDYQGEQLDDIKTPEQNESAADFITDIVSTLTREDQTALHVSIAGGRKTMGYYLGYALSLYGRVQDRLSHVLVTDNYESLKDFFYPTPESHVVKDKYDRSLDAKDAEIMLAEIPFVRLRGGIPNHLLTRKTTFNESIKFARKLEEEQPLVIDSSRNTVNVAEIIIPLTDVNYIFYLWMLQRSLDSKPIKRMIDDNPEYAEEFLKLYEKYINEARDYDRTQKAFAKGMSSQWLSDRITAVKRTFEDALGINAAKPYIVQKMGRYNNLNYAITLAEENIIRL